jgi:hypothetical protein
MVLLIKLSSNNDHALTRCTVRKLDFYLLPFLSVMYFFNRQVRPLGVLSYPFLLADMAKALTDQIWVMRRQMVWTKTLALKASSIAC